MSKPVAYSPEEIIALVAPKRTAGSTAETIKDIASLSTAQPGDLSFLGNTKYKLQVAASRASIILVPVDYVGEPAPRQLFLYVEKPSVTLAVICSNIEQRLWPRPAPGVHPTAFIAPGARIAPSATIGPLCVVEADAVVGARSFLQASVFLGRNARVGEDCWVMPGCVVGSECVIGNRVRLQPGVVLGSDGFGYEFVKGRHEKVPQIGSVFIENDVEIGANTTIDRARFSRTVIGEGTKIDNLVQVGHNVIMGKHCLVCGLAAIAGSATFEDYVVVGGQAGVGGHITLGKGTKVGGQTGINYNTEPGAYVIGTPAMSYMLERRLQVLHQRLPDLFKRVEFLELKSEKTSAPA